MLPMHILKGKKMPGQMGNVKRTVQNLEIISVDTENSVILVKGNVPGPKKSFVMIRTAVKRPDEKNTTEELITYTTEQPTEEVVEENKVEETPVEETKEEVVEEVKEEKKEETVEEKEETPTEEAAE